MSTLNPSFAFAVIVYVVVDRRNTFNLNIAIIESMQMYNAIKVHDDQGGMEIYIHELDTIIISL